VEGEFGRGDARRSVQTTSRAILKCAKPSARMCPSVSGHGLTWGLRHLLDVGRVEQSDAVEHLLSPRLGNELFISLHRNMKFGAAS